MAVAALAVFAVTMLGGCLDPYRPLVDRSLVESSPHHWVIENTPEVSHGMFGPNIVETEYRYTPDSDDPQTPGVLIVLGIRTFSQIDSSTLLERTREVVNQALLDEGVAVDPEQETAGERVTAQGSPTQWFSLIGFADSDAVLFGGDEEVRALGETWYDGRSKTHVVVVALGQTTTRGLLGGEERNHLVWNELVGDADGTVDGETNADGFIVNIQSHG